MALNNVLKSRLNDPIQAVKFDEYRTIAINTNKEIDKRLDALISPQKESHQKTLAPDVIKRFVQIFNDATGHSLRTVDDKANRQLQKIILIDNYQLKDLDKAIKSAYSDMTLRETVKHLTPEFITRPAQFSKYLNMKDVTPKKVLSL